MPAANRHRSRKLSKKAGQQRRLSQPDYQRLAEFRYLLRRFLIFSENAAVAAGVTAQQHQALLAVKGFTDGAAVTTGALAERLGIRHHSTVGLVDRLVAKKLFQRRRDPRDRRQVLIELTAKADTLLETLSAIHRSELRRLAPLLRDFLEHFEK